MANNSSFGNFQDRLPFSYNGDSNSVLSRIRTFLPEIRHANSLLAEQPPEQIRCDSDSAFTEGEEHIELDLVLFKKARKRAQDIASGPPARRPLIECLTASECEDRDVDVFNAGDGGHTDTDRPNVVTASSGASDSAASAPASASTSASPRELLDVHEAASLPRLVRDLLPLSDASADEEQESESESKSEADSSHSGASSDDEGGGGGEDDDPLAGRAVRLGVQLSEGKSDASGEIVELRIPGANSPPAPCASHSLLVRSLSSASESDE